MRPLVATSSNPGETSCHYIAKPGGDLLSEHALPHAGDGCRHRGGRGGMPRPAHACARRVRKADRLGDAVVGGRMQGASERGMGGGEGRPTWWCGGEKVGVHAFCWFGNGT
eukprot:352832-Chlamydomonas_euryale.AAC.5